MKKRDYVGSAFYSLRLLKENLILYSPDLILFIITVLLSFLFLHLNGLTSIFTGQISLFNSKMKSIVSSGPLLIKFFVSLFVVLVINLLVGLNVVSLRLAIINNLTKNKSVKFFKSWKESRRFLIPIFLLKFSLVVVYMVPIVILLLISLAYKPLFLFMIILMVVIFVMFKVIFLFIYPILFSKNLRNPIRVMKESIKYFEINKIHTIISGFLVVLVSLIFGIITNLFPALWINLSVYSNLLDYTLFVSIIYLIVKTLLDITIGLWSMIFIFNNY